MTLCRGRSESCGLAVVLREGVASLTKRICTSRTWDLSSLGSCGRETRYRRGTSRHPLHPSRRHPLRLLSVRPGIKVFERLPQMLLATLGHHVGQNDLGCLATACLLPRTWSEADAILMGEEIRSRRAVQWVVRDRRAACGANG